MDPNPPPPDETKAGGSQANLAEGKTATAFHNIIQAQLAGLQSQGQEPTPLQIAEAVKAYAEAEVARRHATDDEITASGVIIDKRALRQSLMGGDDDDDDDEYGPAQRRKRIRLEDLPARNWRQSPLHGTNLVSAICQYGELSVELAKHMNPRDILAMYRTCRPFHDAIRPVWRSTVKAIARFRAPCAMRVFLSPMYKALLIPDPAGPRSCDAPEGGGPAVVRMVPALSWLHMIIDREEKARDMLALLARAGHRMPSTMIVTLLKVWLFNDTGSNAGRVSLLTDPVLFVNRDLYNAQLFLVKLELYFSDPIYGPNSRTGAGSALIRLFMGQRGLLPLWQALFRHKYDNFYDMVQLHIRYRYRLSQAQLRVAHGGLRVFGVPLKEVSRVHKEGWGLGWRHLLRLDEMLRLEASRRGMRLSRHLENMQVWGYFSWQTGENLVPSEAEMYISNEEEKLINVDQTAHWKLRHARKKRWSSLTEKQKRDIIEEEEQEMLRAQVWMDEDLDLPESESDDGMDMAEEEQDDAAAEDQADGDTEAADVADDHACRSRSDHDEYDLEAEMLRGWAIAPQPKSKLDDPEAVAEMSQQEIEAETKKREELFVRNTRHAQFTGYPITEEVRLEAQGHMPYSSIDYPELFEEYEFPYVPDTGQAALPAAVAAATAAATTFAANALNAVADVMAVTDAALAAHAANAAVGAQPGGAGPGPGPGEYEQGVGDLSDDNNNHELGSEEEHEGEGESEGGDGDEDRDESDGYSTTIYTVSDYDPSASESDDADWAAAPDGTNPAVAPDGTDTSGLTMSIQEQIDLVNAYHGYIPAANHAADPAAAADADATPAADATTADTDPAEPTDESADESVDESADEMDLDD